MSHENLSKKYAEMLSREDTNYILFSLLGTTKITEMAKRSGLTRRTLYTLKERQFIQSKTKRKILEAALEINRDATFDFLLNRSKGQAANILMVFLSQLYYETLQKNNVEDFRNSLLNFLKTRAKNFGLVTDELDDEINTMLLFLEQKADLFGVELPPEPIETVKPTHLVATMPFLLNDLYFGEDTPQNLARTYNVPMEYTQSIFIAVNKLSLSTPSSMECEGIETLDAAGAFIPSSFRAKTVQSSVQKIPAATLV